MIPFIPGGGVRKNIEFLITRLFKYQRQFLIAILLMFFLQFSVLNAVLSNLNTIITNANLGYDISLVALFTNVVQLFATAVSCTSVNRLSYRLRWIISVSEQVLLFALMWVYLLFKTNTLIFMIGLYLE